MCEFKGYNIYKIYKDAGISAKTGNRRPAFEELKEDIKKKKINTIVVLKLDRLTRSVYDMENIMKFLEENNAYLDCANDDINTNNANGRMVARLLTTVSQNEIERTSGVSIDIGFMSSFQTHFSKRLFNYNGLDLKYFKQQYDPEYKLKERKIINIFNKKEVEKATKHINDEMEKSAEAFYDNKQKDDDLSL